MFKREVEEVRMRSAALLARRYARQVGWVARRRRYTVAEERKRQSLRGGACRALYGPLRRLGCLNWKEACCS